MRHSLPSKIISLTLLVLFPAAAITADGRAMLLPHGIVGVNGNMQARSIPLFPGDRITTTDKSTGTITASGSTIELGAQSSVLYKGAEVQVASGAASVATSAGIIGKLANLTVTPAARKAKYSFGVRGKRVMIAALEGRLRVGDGSRQVMLQPGTAIMLPAGQDRTAGGGGSPDPAAGGSHLSDAVAVGIAAATVALGTTLGFVAAEEKPPTPASPQ